MRIAGPEKAIHCRQKGALAPGTGTVRLTSDSEACPAGVCQPVLRAASAGGLPLFHNQINVA